MAIIQVPPPDSPPRWKIHLPRVSLLTFLLLVTIVCLLASQWSLVRDHRALLAEAKLWRRNVGHLEITDPTKIHAVKVDALEVKTWKWRVYVPADADVQLNALVREIPEEGIPTKATTDQPLVSASELFITAALRLDAKGDWQLVLHMDRFAESQLPQLNQPANPGIILPSGSATIRTSLHLPTPNGFIRAMDMRGAARIHSSRTTASRWYCCDYVRKMQTIQHGTIRPKV